MSIGDFFRGLVFWRKKRQTEVIPVLPADDDTIVQPPPTRFPQATRAHQRTLEFVVDYCRQVIGEPNLIGIYLIGSRSNVPKQPRPNSDHDILIVLDNAYPGDIYTGSIGHTQFIVSADVKMTQSPK